MPPFLKILALQPFYGGSHRQFNEGWIAHSSHAWTTLKLPARYWKWRMRHAAVTFSAEVNQRCLAGERWDAIVCSDMLNVAEFRGLTSCSGALPITVYVHENQFEYPSRAEQSRDFHFAFTNFTSALAADQIWFNSQFNRDSMLAGIETQFARMPDKLPATAIDSIAAKSSVVYPGIEVPQLDWSKIAETRRKRWATGQPLHLIWAARWEHDKNPLDLLRALRQLRQRQVPFRLSVIGQQFKNVPPEFFQIQTEFSDSIKQWGFVPGRVPYWQALADADVFVSTANHEFFGLSVAEAIATGLWPLLPNRLAYPELLEIAELNDDPQRFLYGQAGNQLAEAVERLHVDRTCFQEAKFARAGQCFREKLDWRARSAELDRMVCGHSIANGAIGKQGG